MIIGLLSVHLGLWLSLKMAQCKNLPSMTNRPNAPFCYNSKSGKDCYAILVDNKSHRVRTPFKEASRLCKVHVPGSSLIVIESKESQRNVQVFIKREQLENETIIIDAHRLSASENPNWSWVNGHPYSPDILKGKYREFRYN